MDKLTAERRSANMRQIRSSNTKPELTVRRVLFAMGYRYRLHANELPGKPDVVLRSRRKVIFVHGCFWHQHDGCREGRIPGSRVDYWRAKFKRTAERDRRNANLIKAGGWGILVIWECETTNAESLKRILKSFLES